MITFVLYEVYVTEPVRNFAVNRSVTSLSGL